MGAEIEALELAQNLARNCGYAVFPCRRDKTPATPHGFKDATNDPKRIGSLWRRWPGPLIGIATGELSGVSVLDLDIKHPGARAWWHANKHRIPQTRAYRTLGGGVHFYWRHRSGVRSKQACFGTPGIDTRGDGGYAIFWFGAGLECVEHAPPAPWPEWLHREIWPPPKPQLQRVARLTTYPANIAGIIRTLREAREGTRNSVLFWAANRLRDQGIREAEVQHLLGAAAADCGLPGSEAQRTIASAWRAVP